MNSQSKEKQQGKRCEAAEGHTLPEESVLLQEWKEPQMRRWHHPVSAEEEPAWRYLCQAMGYQNQLLSEIKVLLEKLYLK